MPDSDIILSTTQDHLEVETISKDLAVLKDGTISLVMQVSAINFGLLSEEEQDATIYAYAGLLNSLSFPIQIIIRSTKKDISGYLESLSAQEEKLKDFTYKHRMQAYRKFIEDTIVEQNVLDKNFYVVIPFQQVTLKSSIDITEDLIIKAGMDLNPKKEHLTKLFARIGLTAEQLNSQSLLKLFFKYYNPDSRGQSFAPADEYEKTIVAPNIDSLEEESLPETKKTNDAPSTKS